MVKKGVILVPEAESPGRTDKACQSQRRERCVFLLPIGPVQPDSRNANTDAQFRGIKRTGDDAPVNALRGIHLLV